MRPLAPWVLCLLPLTAQSAVIDYTFDFDMRVPGFEDLGSAGYATVEMTIDTQTQQLQYVRLLSNLGSGAWEPFFDTGSAPQYVGLQRELDVVSYFFSDVIIPVGADRQWWNVLSFQSVQVSGLDAGQNPLEHLDLADWSVSMFFDADRLRGEKVLWLSHVEKIVVASDIMVDVPEPVSGLLLGAGLVGLLGRRAIR